MAEKRSMYISMLHTKIDIYILIGVQTFLKYYIFKYIR